MLRHTRLGHRFVHHIPEGIEEGVIYISMDFATAVHKCCCGCGEEVVTPFAPTDWKMVFDGEAVSLSPSIGNWNMACRSHYWIERGEVIDAESWTKNKVELNRRQDPAAKTDHHNGEVPSFWTRIKRKATHRRRRN